MNARAFGLIEPMETTMLFANTLHASLCAIHAAAAAEARQDAAPTPTTTMQHDGPVTIYEHTGPLGYRRTEARALRVLVRPYAQHSAGVEIRFIPKGGRREREYTETTHATTVILAGHGHPEPPSPWNAPKDHGAYVTQQAHERSTLASDFAAVLAATVADGARVLLDLRGHDPSRPLTPDEERAWAAWANSATR